jgi:hypothetical protein
MKAAEAGTGGRSDGRWPIVWVRLVWRPEFSEKKARPVTERRPK